MKNTRLPWILIAVMPVFLVTCKPAPETSQTATTATQAKRVAVEPLPPSFCGEAATLCGGVQQCAPPRITAAAAEIPTAARCIPKGEGGNPAQQFVDAYSWNMFLALNWPAKTEHCRADPSKSILDVRSDDGTYVVWQTYMPGERVFVNPGYQKPAAWCSGNGLLEGANRVLDQEAKAVPNALAFGGSFVNISEPGQDVLQAAHGVVTDQSGRWLRYERLMNEVEYKYIVADKWNFPQLEALHARKHPIRIPAGSIELKASWKILTEQERKSGRYFVTRAKVCNTPEGQRTPCDDKPVALGLVGLHIVQQANDGGTMFWATFEQNDNDTVFYNKASKSPVNKDLAKQPYVELDANCQPINTPTQIVRRTPIHADPQLNRYYQQILGDSVFANYRLISTQWNTGTANGGTPSDVANITLETYVQRLSVPLKPEPVNATGCMACHLHARTRIKGQSSNHSFFFVEAQSATMPPKGSS